MQGHDDQKEPQSPRALSYSGGASLYEVPKKACTGNASPADRRGFKIPQKNPEEVSATSYSVVHSSDIANSACRLWHRSVGAESAVTRRYNFSREAN